MSLSSTELQFIEKRERLTKSWPVVGAGILGVFFAFTCWLWVKVPHMINPWAVSESIKEGALPESTTNIMAAILPMVMLTFLVFAVSAVLLAFAAFSNERRLIRIVRELGAGSANESSRSSQS